MQSSDKPGSVPIGKAVKQASAGDVVILEPGIYREHVIINKSLTLRGLPGAIMNGAKRSTLAWRQADDLPGVYVASAKKKDQRSAGRWEVHRRNTLHPHNQSRGLALEKITQ